jgi:hypothetical protein
MMQSRSISPKRRPPSRARPSTGCRVRICTGPRPLHSGGRREGAGPQRKSWLRFPDDLPPLEWVKYTAGPPPTHPPRVYFVVHHVLEALVVGGVEEDLGLQLSPRVPVVHHLPTAALVATPALRASVGDGFVKRKAVVRGCRVAIRRQRVSSCCFFPAWPMPCSLQPAHTAHLCSAAEILSTVTDVKGVASPSLPMQAATCKKRRIQ